MLILCISQRYLISELLERIPSMTNREHGRKLYNELWKIGCRNLNMHY